jgi:hypothetical protein
MSSDSNCYKVVQQKWKHAEIVKLGPLDVLDKEMFVQNKLAQYAKKLEDTPFNSQVGYSVIFDMIK